MRYLPLLLAGFRRKRLRTFFTVASVLVAFLLFRHQLSIAGLFGRAPRAPAPAVG